jgi:hypothetical protein
MEQSLPSYRRKLLDVNVAALRAGYARYLSARQPAWALAEVA